MRNASVEEELIASGLQVLAVGALQEDVDLVSAHGVAAVRADVRQWTPDAQWPVIYTDGLFGHLYRPDEGLTGIFTRIQSWLTPGGTLIVANDAPKNGQDAEEAPGVTGFHRPSVA